MRIKETRDKKFMTFLGKKLKEQRIKRRLTLMEVANAIGISYQQVQKYESATSQISAQLLYKMSKLYCVPIEYLFEGYKCKEQFSTFVFKETQRVFNILIIEDNPGDEVITKHALKDIRNLNILCVHDGMQALEVLKYKTFCIDFPEPDLIFLDIYLPKDNGLALLKEIKRNKEFIKIPIVMLTNNVDSKIMTLAYDDGAVGYICKTFDFEEFKKNVVNCVNYWFHSIILPSRISSSNLDVIPKYRRSS